MRVDLVQLGRLLLERECLFLEQHVVLVELDLGELLRPLRRHQRLAEVAVDGGDAVGRGGRDVGDAVLGGDRVRLQRLIHLLLLELELALQGLDQRDLAIRLGHRLGHRQRRGRGEVAGAVGTCRAAGLVGGEDLAHQRRLARRVARSLAICARR